MLRRVDNTYQTVYNHKQPSSCSFYGTGTRKSLNETGQLNNSKKDNSTGKKVAYVTGGLIISGLLLDAIVTKGKYTKSIFEKICGSKKVQDKIIEMPYLDKYQANFSKIFNREVSKEEAKEMALKYREIFSLSDNNKFLGDLFTQIKKDYKLPDIPFYMKELKNNNYYAYFSPTSGINYNMNLLKTQSLNGEVKIIEVDRVGVAEALCHEFKHAKQHEMACRTDFDVFIKAIVEREKRDNSTFFKTSLNNTNNNISKAVKDCEMRLKEQFLDSFKNLEKYPKDSAEYKKGLEYIKSERNYITSQENYTQYKEQLLEKEAFEAGAAFRDVCGWLFSKAV